MAMTGLEFKRIQKKLGMSNPQMGDAIGVKDRKITDLRSNPGEIERVYELAIKAIYFGVADKSTAEE